MHTVSALRALCDDNPPVTGWFHWQMANRTEFYVLFDVNLNKRLNKHSRRRWFETPGCSLWRYCNSIAKDDLLHVRPTDYIASYLQNMSFEPHLYHNTLSSNIPEWDRYRARAGALWHVSSVSNVLQIWFSATQYVIADEWQLSWRK